VADIIEQYLNVNSTAVIELLLNHSELMTAVKVSKSMELLGFSVRVAEVRSVIAVTIVV